MNSKIRSGLLLLAACSALGSGLGLALGAGSALADDGEEHSARRPAVVDPTYRAECGGCHVAFPPRLLSAESWRAVMGSLDKHFGSDASLDPATHEQIAAFLQSQAGRRSTRDAHGAPATRITETEWFMREHRPGHEGLPRGVFASAEVHSPANCAACHQGAADGDYSEHRIRIPSPSARR